MQLFNLNTPCIAIVPWNVQSTYTHQYPHDHVSMMSQMTTHTSQLPPQPSMHEIPPPPPPSPLIGSIMGGRNSQAGSQHYQDSRPA